VSKMVQTRDHGCPQGDGVVCGRDGINGEHTNVYVLTSTLKMDRRKKAYAASRACAHSTRHVVNVTHYLTD
jgi:hypothetical protein